MANTVKWLSYDFHVLTLDASWTADGGIYIFTGLKDNTWHPYYVGIADSLKVRLATHERWSEAVQLGATHVHARVASLAATREAIEKELIAQYQPPLNTHHR